MPEDQSDQEDVKNDEAAEVASQEAESSTVDNREDQADAEPANTEEQPAKPERTIPLKAAIAERTKHKNRIKELEAKLAEQTESTQVSKPENPAARQADSSAPKMSDPDIDYDPEKFAKATAAFEVRKAIREEREKSAIETAKSEWNGKLSAFDQNVAKLAEDAPEYAELIKANGENGHGDDVITAAIVESDAGPDMDYYLLAHPDEAARISALPTEVAKWREMGRIESAAMEFASSNKKKGVTNQVTQAPRPIETAGNSGVSTSDPRYDPEVSFADYRAAKNTRAAQG